MAFRGSLLQEGINMRSTGLDHASGVIIAGCFAFMSLVSGSAMAQDLLASTGGGGGGSVDAGSIVLVDTGDASGTVLSTPYNGTGMPGIAFANDGRLYAVTGVNNGEVDTAQLLELDPATGDLISVVGDLFDDSGNGCAFMDISFHPNTGELYAMVANNSAIGTRCGVGGGSGGYLATIDLATTEYTIIGRDPSFDNVSGGIAFAPDGTLYFSPAWESSQELHILDIADGTVASSIALSEDRAFTGLAWHPSENLLYAGYDWSNSERTLSTIDPSDGTIVNIGTTEDRVLMGLAFRGQPPQAPALAVPAFSGSASLVLMMLIALFGLVIVRRF